MPARCVLKPAIIIIRVWERPPSSSRSGIATFCGFLGRPAPDTARSIGLSRCPFALQPFGTLLQRKLETLRHGVSAAPALLTGLMSLLNCLGEALGPLHDLNVPVYCLVRGSADGAVVLAAEQPAVATGTVGSPFPRGRWKAAARCLHTQRRAFWRQRLLRPRDSVQARNHGAVCIGERVSFARSMELISAETLHSPTGPSICTSLMQPACLISSPHVLCSPRCHPLSFPISHQHALDVSINKPSYVNLLKSNQMHFSPLSPGCCGNLNRC